MSMFDDFEFDDALESMDDDIDIDDIPDFDDIDDDYDDDFDSDVDPIFESADDTATDLTVAAEAAIFMDTLLESCESEEEFVDYVTENATEWELYGMIPSAERALEAIKTIKVTDWKIKNRNRAQHRECIRLAYKSGDPNYKKYKKFRDLMRKFRALIFKKWDAKAKANVMKAKRNNIAKASSINTKSGNTLKKRLNTAMVKSDKGKNPSRAPANSKHA